MKYKRFLSILLVLVMIFTLLPVLTPPAKAAGSSVTISKTTFPDADFRGYVSDNLDKNGDNVLSADEIADVTSIDVRGTYGWDIKDLTGVEYFTALTYLDVEGNSLTKMDLRSNTALEHVF